MSKDLAPEAGDVIFSPLCSALVFEGFCVETGALFVLKSDDAVECVTGADLMTGGTLSGALGGVDGADCGFIRSGSALVGSTFSGTIHAPKTVEANTYRDRNSLDVRLVERSESEFERLLRLALGFKTRPDCTTM
jgi:hypothetical protein